SKAQFGIGTSEIWMYHVDGGSGVQITKSKPTPTTERNKRPNAMGVVASPDEKYLYYAAKLGSLYYNQQLPTWYIARRDRKTGDEFPGYAFLPGGKEIVYNQDGKIKRLDLATGAEKIIPFTAQVSEELGPKLDFPQTVEQGPVKARLIMDPAESPDGKKLAFS